MKALVLEGKRQLRLRQLPTPEPQPGEVLLEVELAGIGGSEYLGFNNPGIRPLPSIMGHGFAGRTAAGERMVVNPLRSCGTCRQCAAGMGQLCDDWSLIGVQQPGGFAEQVVVPERALVSLPTELSWEQSAFIEPFANSINAWQLAGGGWGDTVAVIGAGGLGLGVVACAAEAGCKVVHVCDLAEARQNAAIKLGASYASVQLLGPFDLVFDTVGTQQTRGTAVELTRRGGKTVFLGFSEAMFDINLSEVIRHQKQLIGSFVYSDEQFRQAIHLAQRVDAKWVRSLAFSEVAAQLLSYLRGEFSTVKAALRPGW